MKTLKQKGFVAALIAALLVTVSLFTTERVDAAEGDIKTLQSRRVVNNAAGTITLDNATANAVATVLTVRKTTSGTPANGLGPCYVFEAENSANANVALAQVCGAWDDVTSTSEDGRILWYTKAAGGSLTERARMISTGELGLGKTPSAGVELDVNGDVAATTVAVGGGTALTKLVKGSLADDASGWVPDGAATDFTITADAASVAATSVITVSIDQATAATCSVYDVTATTSFKVKCSAAPANGGTLQYLIVN